MVPGESHAKYLDVIQTNKRKQNKSNQNHRWQGEKWNVAPHSLFLMKLELFEGLPSKLPTMAFDPCANTFMQEQRMPVVTSCNPAAKETLYGNQADLGPAA